MEMEVDDVVELYREWAKFPTPLTSRFMGPDNAHGVESVYTEWSQDDIVRGEKVTFCKTYIVNSSNQVMQTTLPQSSTLKSGTKIHLPEN
jgi:hypothetical protein